MQHPFQCGLFPCLASCGKVPLANTFSFLFATRALEMVRTHLCCGRANVKLMGAYSGLSDSFDGPTHHSITDIAIMRSLPNMTVVDAGVIEMHTVKPLDVQCILQAAQQTGAIVTVEEHSMIGGLGAAVAEVVTENHPVPVRRVGIADRFAETGPYNDLLDHYGMSQKDIIEAAHKVLAVKK